VAHAGVGRGAWDGVYGIPGAFYFTMEPKDTRLVGEHTGRLWHRWLRKLRHESEAMVNA
jgi:hypothetical protein